MQLFEFNPKNLPAPAFEDRVQTAWERYEEIAQKAPENGEDLVSFVTTLKTDPVGAKLAAAIFGNSPFLTACWLNDPLFTKDLFVLGPSAMRDQILTATRVGSQELNETQLKTHLRIQKKRMALTTAVADICGCWGLFDVTGALSDFADAATSAACAHQLCALAKRGKINLKTPMIRNLAPVWWCWAWANWAGVN